MEHQDEVFESIPWDRLGSLDRAADQRRWLLIGMAVLLVGVTAFAVRRMPTGSAPVVAAVPDPVVETIAPTTTTAPPELAEAHLWADIPLARADRTAERFAIELLAGSGVRVAGVMAEGGPSGSSSGEVDVVAVLITDTGPETIAFRVEVGGDGAVSRWWPAAVEPVDVRVPLPGAEPPPDVLSEFTRVAGRWGTTLEVISSGLSGDRWWAELLVRLPSGTELPVMVWEGT